MVADEAHPPKQTSHRLVIGLAIAVVMVGVGVGVGVAVSQQSKPTIPAGSGTATIIWKPVPGSKVPPAIAFPSNQFTGTLTPRPQPFSGTIAGLSVRGIATKTPSSLNTGTFGKPMQRQLFQWKGAFDGSAFNLGLFIELTLAGEPNVFFRVTGRWGTEDVSVIAPYQDPGSPIAFHGTVGSRKVSGSVDRPKGNQERQVVVATFTVSK